MGRDTACAPEGHPDRLVEEGCASPCRRAWRDIVEANQLARTKRHTRSLLGEKVVFNVPQIMKEFAHAIPACASKEGMHHRVVVQTVDFPRATDLGGNRWRRCSSTNHGGNRESCSRGRGHGQSLMEVQVEPRLFVVFSFLGVPGSQVVCAHRLAKHVILRGLALLPTTVRPQ